MKVIVIIPAAGLGTRMSQSAGPGSKPGSPKQFTEIDGVPILLHTIRRFTRMSEVAELYIALREPETREFAARLKQETSADRVHIVEGGEHRQQSVSNALKSVSASADDVVLVHDAVRPLVEADTIQSVIAAVERHGAAIAGIPAIDTVKQVERTAEGAIISSTIPRERVVLAQTPQGFRFALLQRAFEQAEAEGFIGTDEASLVEHLGEEVAVVMGSSRNIKITTPGDLELAEFFFSHESRRRNSLTG
ncbi:MAG: 2-C-methyl-D-erythritol 4-phosphate cytidylyltransferase [Acidobacteria bacterium]|nr:2-C-methyl-D-erythritol 4-phosphate cytidylyltransferase [Acidobacteriota bacterium]